MVRIYCRVAVVATTYRTEIVNSRHILDADSPKDYHIVSVRELRRTLGLRDRSHQRHLAQHWIEARLPHLSRDGDDLTYCFHQIHRNLGILDEAVAQPQRNLDCEFYGGLACRLNRSRGWTGTASTRTGMALPHQQFKH